MRKPLIVIALLAATIFAAGYLIGQVGGVGASSAAGTTASATPTAPHWMGRFGGQQRPDAAGQVTGVNGDTVTITPGGFRHDQSSVNTILLSSSTTYNQGFGPSAAAATRSSIKAGAFVIARGTLSSDGTMLTATEITVLPSAPTGGGFGHSGGFGHMGGPGADGTVTAINGNTITIKPHTDRAGSQEGSVTSIVVSSSTQYDAGPGVTAGKDSVKVGGFVRAEGTLSAGGKTLTASLVSVRSGGQPGTPVSPFGGTSGAST
jgi:Domain of unknown function (DUF5666)